MIRERCFKVRIIVQRGRKKERGGEGGRETQWSNKSEFKSGKNHLLSPNFTL